MSASEIEAARKIAARFRHTDRDRLTSEEELALRVSACCDMLARSQDAEFYANLMYGLKVWRWELSVGHNALPNFIQALKQRAPTNDQAWLSIVQCAFDEAGELRAPSKFVRSLRTAATRLDRVSKRQGARCLSEAAAAIALRKIAVGVDAIGLQRGRPKGSGSVQSELVREVFEHLLTAGFDAERLLDPLSDHLFQCVLEASEFYDICLTGKSVRTAIRKFRHDENKRLTA